MKKIMSNPLISRAINQESITESWLWVMSINWTIGKSLIMMIILFASAVYARNQALLNPFQVNIWLIWWSIAWFILVIISIFKPKRSPIIAPLYALAEWFVLWVFSVFFETIYPWIAAQAILATGLVVWAMLLLYRFRIIKVTEKLKSVIFWATLAIALYYIISFVLSIFFNIESFHFVDFRWESSWISIWFSALVIVVAALNLLRDFDNIEKWAKKWLAKYYERYFSIWLMVTIVWLYLEILRLLAKLRNR